MILPLAKVSPVMSAIAVLWLFVAIALILIILIQKGKGGGLSGAFGGMGSASGLLGTKTGDFLTWVTIGLVVVFLFLAVVMVKFYKPKVSDDLKTPQTKSAMPAELPQEQTQPITSETGTNE